jgi:hypothetical protein
MNYYRRTALVALWAVSLAGCGLKVDARHNYETSTVPYRVGV